MRVKPKNSIPAKTTFAMMRLHRVALLTLLLALFSQSRLTQARELGDDMLSQVLGTQVDGFPAADPGYQLQFPRDYGAHPEFRNEWWYLTGNLEDAQGRHFGYQFTLFRFATQASKESEGVIPATENRSNQEANASSTTSAWHSQQLYMAHFAISDSQNQGFYHAERFSRGALGLAGVEQSPLRAWLYDWQFSAKSSDDEPPWQLQLQARMDEKDGGSTEFTLDLELNLDHSRVLQGQQGYSRKGGEAASHYYSYPRLRSAGTLRIGDQAFPVHGSSWLDREWGSGGLAAHQQGWDWFALQLEDGSDLMWYQLRLKDGGLDPASQGVWITPDGQRQNLDLSQLQMTPISYWSSPDGRCYPVKWRAALAGLPAMAIQARFPQQWWDGAFRYWEGAVNVTAEGSQQVLGQGYLELSGYPKSDCPDH